MDTHRSLQGGEPRELGASNPFSPNPPIPPTSLTDEYSTLIEALLTFAPETFELVEQVSSEAVSFEQGWTRSFEIGSITVWERFVATLQAESEIGSQQDSKSQDLLNFIQGKLRYWIDQHPQGRCCLLHLNMAGLPHDTFCSVFMKAVQKRLDALPQLFPENQLQLDDLCEQIIDTRSGSWPLLLHKQPDSTLSFGGEMYGFPGLIIEVGYSQKWEGSKGVKNKAIEYEDNSKGSITGVLYLGYGDKSIGCIGSKKIFSSYPAVKYLDGSLSKYAVEVIPLTSLTNPAYSKCLLVLELAYFGMEQVLSCRLRPEEQKMGFSFTFEEILQMMEMIDKIPRSHQQANKNDDPPKLGGPWNSATAIQAGLFKTPRPELPAYAPARAYDNVLFEDSSLHEEEDVDDDSSSSYRPAKGQADTDSIPSRESACLARR